MDTKTKLLYVDDEEMNVFLFEMNFSTKYEVYVARSGMEGLEVLDKNPDIEVVISDMKMPVMTGLEFVKLVKEKYSNIKCYILSGYELNEDIQSAVDSKLIEHYFRKPMITQDIERIISGS